MGSNRLCGALWVSGYKRRGRLGGQQGNGAWTRRSFGAYLVVARIQQSEGMSKRSDSPQSHGQAQPFNGHVQMLAMRTKANSTSHSFAKGLGRGGVEGVGRVLSAGLDYLCTYTTTSTTVSRARGGWARPHATGASCYVPNIHRHRHRRTDWGLKERGSRCGRTIKVVGWIGQVSGHYRSLSIDIRYCKTYRVLKRT